MTFNEFTAWLEGFSEAFDDGAPNEKQWKKIKEKLEELKTSTKYQPAYRGNELIVRKYDDPVDLNGKSLYPERKSTPEPMYHGPIPPEITLSGTVKTTS